MVVTNEMIEAAKQKGRDLSGGMPGAFQEACAEIALAGLTAALAVAPGVKETPPPPQSHVVGYNEIYQVLNEWGQVWGGHDMAPLARKVADLIKTPSPQPRAAVQETNVHE